MTQTEESRPRRCPDRTTRSLLLVLSWIALAAGAQVYPESESDGDAPIDLCAESSPQAAGRAGTAFGADFAAVCQLERRAADAARQGRWTDETDFLRQAVAGVGALRSGPFAKSATAIQEESLDHWRARLGSMLGVRLTDQGAYEEARSTLGSVLTWLEAARATPLVTAEALVALAQTERDAGLGEASAAWLQRASAVLDGKHSSSLVAARIHRLQGRLALDQRKFVAAAEQLASARAILEGHQPPPRIVIDQRNAEGALAARQGDLDEAQRLFAEAQALLEASEAPSPRFARSLNNLGAVAYFRGDLVTAQESWQRAVELDLQFVPDGHTALAPLGNLGAVLKDRGRFDEAEVVLRRVVELARNEPPESKRLAEAHEALGKLYYNRRDYDRAAIEYERAVAEGGPEALLLAHMGQLAQVRGDIPGGMAYLQQAEDLLEHQPDDGTYRAFIEHEQAAGLRRTGDLEAARAKVRSALQRYRTLNSSVNLSPALIRLVEIEIEAGRLAEARAAAEESLALARKFAPDSPETARAAAFLGQVLRLQGHIDRARSLICGAADQLDAQTLASGAFEEDRKSFREAHVRIYRLCADLRARHGRADLAIEVMARLRGQSLRAELAERFLDLSAAVPTDLRSRLVRNRTLLERASARRDAARARPEVDRAAIEALDTAIREIREERTALFEELRSAAPMLAELQTPKAPTVRELAAALPEGALRLSYVTAKESTWLLVLDARGRASAFEIAIDRQALQEAVEVLDRSLRRPDDEAYLGPARRLGQLLVQPIVARLADHGPVTPLLIVPDGPLHRVPFAALRVVDGHGDARFLVELAAPHFALVGNQESSERTGRPVPPADGLRLVALADPTVPASESTDGTQRGSTPWPALPGARREARQIASLFPDAGVWVGEEATPDALLQQAPAADLLHLAVHTEIDPIDPLGSAVVLAAGDRSAGDAGTHRRGRLEAWELAEDLSLDADLVTLAACETAQGPLQEGEGLLGLMRTFRLVGARRVVASLWNVSDQATSGLMVDFYRRLRRGEEPTKALAGAQRGLATGAEESKVNGDRTTRGVGGLRAAGRDSDRLWRHPYYWAAFQIYQ